MKTKYEYDVVDKATEQYITYGNTRNEARNEKAIYEYYSEGKKAKIIQHKYVLAESKEVR